MTRWLWIRHAPTHARSFTGHRDIAGDLSDRAALDRLDAWLPRPALLVASDLRRARETADALTKGRRRLPDTAALREFDFGVWDGLAFPEVAARDPELSRRFWEEPGELRAPQGESWNDVAGRVSAEVDRLTEIHRGATICAVAHMGVILSQIARAPGMTPYAALGHEVAPLSVTEMTLEGGSWHPGRINLRP